MSVAADVRPARAIAYVRSELWMRVAALAIASGVISTVMRLVAVGPAQDIFVDEPIYTAAGHSALSTPLPVIDGHPFFLHPPGFFYLEAAWEWLFGYRSDLVARVYEMRQLNALLAGATATVLVLLVVRAAKSLRPAAAAAALYALDPFCIRQSGRVLLETSMMLWVLLGYFVLLPLIEVRRSSGPRRPVALRQGSLVLASRPGQTAGRRERQLRIRAACAGLLFGLAILTKDEAVFVTVLPVLAAAVLWWRSPRRPLLLLVAGASAVPYAIYLAGVAAAGDLGEFWIAKSAGALRLAGLLQFSGFNAPGAPSLATRLVSEVPYFGTTYGLLALSLPAIVVLHRHGNASQRLLALFGASATLLLGYALFVGTLEEQALYVMLVPGFVTISVAGGLVANRYRDSKRSTAVAWSLFVALVLAVNVNTYLQWRLHPDNGYARLRHYMAAHVPAGSTIGVADGDPANGRSDKGPSSRILEDRYRVGRWLSPRDLYREKVRYLVVPWKEVTQGYSHVSVRTVRRLTNGAALLFSFTGRTYGMLALYRVPPSRYRVSPERVSSSRARGVR